MFGFIVTRRFDGVTNDMQRMRFFINYMWS